LIGAWREALDLAKNMVSLPQHPRWNVPSNNRCSSYYGRRRLVDVLEKFELGSQTIELAKTGFFEIDGDVEEKTRRLRQLGRAYWQIADSDGMSKQIAELEALLTQVRADQDKAVKEAVKQAVDDYQKAQKEKAGNDQKQDAEKQEVPKTEVAENAPSEPDKELKKQTDAARKRAERPFRGKITGIDRAKDELTAYLHFHVGENDEGVKLLRKSKCDPLTLANYESVAGNHAEAEKIARKEVKSHKEEVLPLAALTGVLWAAGKKDDAKSTFDQLRKLSSEIDLDCSPLARLSPIAKELGLPDDWRLPREMPDDLGHRPPLDELGPKFWRPYAANDWTLADAQGQKVSLKQYRGKPIVVIFYLGFGCLHCVEQLEAFAPLTKDYAEAGIELVAISTDDQKKLADSLAAYEEGKFPFMLVSDESLDTFKAYHAFDDFEQQPLHATLLIDGEGNVRWQDISYEPFSDAQFLLKEAKRLLSLPKQ
jgi:peroxiredoxin